jgi:hypothetical protein
MAAEEDVGPSNIWKKNILQRDETDRASQYSTV